MLFERSMQVARQNWWLPLVRGIIAILFGIAIFLWPGPLLFVTIVLFATFALLNGIMAIVASIQERRVSKNWWVLLIEGIVSVLGGLVAFAWPGITAVAIFYVVAIWAVLTGIMEIVGAFTLGRAMSSEWSMGLIGILSVVIGVILFFMAPVAGILTLLYALAFYALFAGIFWIVRAFQARRLPTTAGATY
jgi:uncharacterized membrane protein HdeD (DUF308 family)